MRSEKLQERDGDGNMCGLVADVLRERFCQFHILMVWSSDADKIHGSSWWKKTVRT